MRAPEQRNRGPFSSMPLWLIVFIGMVALIVASVVPNPMARAPGQQPQQPDTELPDFVGGLMDTEGCLGVETAQTAGGKQVIFAWFESKEAVLNWYYSDMHKGVQNRGWKRCARFANRSF